MEQHNNGQGWSASSVETASPRIDAEVCLAALAEDSGCDVLIIAEDGNIEFANEQFLRRHGGNGAGGRNLRELLPGGVGEEWIRTAHRAVQDSRPIVLDGVVGGVRTRTRFRAASDTDGSRRVLAVAWRSSPTEPKLQNEQAVQAEANDRGTLGNLTERETEVLRLIGQGLSTADIARHLHRSVKTIEWHRVSLGNKLGITNRVELARIAISAGISRLGSIDDMVGARESETPSTSDAGSGGRQG